MRRSKKRVRAVITTELPFLVSKEFFSGVANDPNAIKNSGDRFSRNSTADLHKERWRTLFDQMDEALSEEEKQLVSICSCCNSFIILSYVIQLQICIKKDGEYCLWTSSMVHLWSRVSGHLVYPNDSFINLKIRVCIYLFRLR